MQNLAFWNAMADGRLETISSCINLLVLLLLLTLGGTLYNGKTTNGAWVLGWIMIAQVGFFYLLVLLVKFIYIPSIERDI
jgi:hypothetical protein